MEGFGRAVGARLRQARRDRGLTVTELASRSGVARATLTAIEGGGGNPRLETMYALADTLEIALGDLLPRSADPSPTVVVRAGEGAQVVGDSLVATLLAEIPSSSARVDVYAMTVSGPERVSDEHPRGTTEHLLVHSGTLVTGPASDPVTLRAGDYARFAADTRHVYRAVDGLCDVTLLVVSPERPADR
ncbi:XRE family transcriptional regulator [Galbitalea sp. SE-J8]|uniref:helix-turn-helix domain-containing protein n=1 Tax=Galbitalea sp. SE-J8 TaxID=3054952 RepID=UPI00259D1ABC|nr:XRE family transcriptional regulator [Galbitalea sp. SE-J8]MDM4763685.1 XRE family transcriptional regulator [Galbitalea sp. SE-J8]